jgi:hypothetical protein
MRKSRKGDSVVEIDVVVTGGVRLKKEEEWTCQVEGRKEGALEVGSLSAKSTIWVPAIGTSGHDKGPAKQAATKESGLGRTWHSVSPTSTPLQH